MCAHNSLSREIRARNTRALEYLQRKQSARSGDRFWSFVVVALIVAVVLVVLQIVS